MTTTATTTLSDADFDVPIQDRFFEDYIPGSVYVYGRITMTERDIPPGRRPVSASRAAGAASTGWPRP
ncbi:hypothetical protein OG223_01885 [Streptomyces sp. NBC_01478]|jgi:hypothetical protein|uniref:hypothetical protein n=1 Tax=Streptomyces sp. NBC_01478 TaxID=2903882 RepID=UPI002E37B2ED|nr:hypothetical protein [Streptomyces sp. NBC_01478]